MRKFFAQFGIRPWAVVAIFLGGIFILLWCELWSKPWITPLPGVVMEPARPILKIENVKPDSAFDFLRRASEEQEKIDMTKYYDGTNYIDTEIKKLNLEPWMDASFPMSLKYFNKGGGILDLVGKAVEAGDTQVPTNMSPLESFPYLDHLNYISKLLVISAAKDVAHGDFHGAYADLNESIDFADILSRGGAMSPRIKEIFFQIRSLQAMRYIALQNKTPADVAGETIRHLDKVDKAMEPWAEVFRQECRTVPTFINLAFYSKDNPLNLGSIFSKSRYIGPLTGSSPGQVRQDIESIYAHWIEIAEKEYDPGSMKKMDDLYSLPGKRGTSILLTVRDPLGYLLALLRRPAFSQYTILHYTRLADLRATEVVIAICQFEQDENHSPSNLGELVPKYFPAVPLDPFDGKPLRYSLKSDGSWIVYSVGPNKIDEGGLDAPKRPTDYDMPGDLVYPSTEAVDAKKKLEEKEAKEKAMGSDL